MSRREFSVSRRAGNILPREHASQQLFLRMSVPPDIQRCFAITGALCVCLCHSNFGQTLVFLLHICVYAQAPPLIALQQRKPSADRLTFPKLSQ